jgi:L-fuculose-phosphate aldolase
MRNEWQLRKEICEVGQRVHERGLVAATDGNISARTFGDRLLITPSGSCLGMLRPEDLIMIDHTGRVLASRGGRPSTERWMHIAAYQQRPDVMGVVHAHPAITVAFSVAGVTMPQRALPEVILAFGQIPVTAYATPATEEGAVVVRDLIARFDALVLERHGSLTVGGSVMEAFFKLEQLEHAARVILMARQLGNVQELPAEELAKLAALREKLGLGRAEDVPM